MHTGDGAVWDFDRAAAARQDAIEGGVGAELETVGVRSFGGTDIGDEVGKECAAEHVMMSMSFLFVFFTSHELVYTNRRKISK